MPLDKDRFKLTEFRFHDDFRRKDAGILSRCVALFGFAQKIWSSPPTLVDDVDLNCPDCEVIRLREQIPLSHRHSHDLLTEQINHLEKIDCQETPQRPLERLYLR